MTTYVPSDELINFLVFFGFLGIALIIALLANDIIIDLVRKIV